MAEAKITGLTEMDATPDDGDQLEIVDDPGGTPVSKRITVANLRAGMALPLLHVRDEKASGTAGGASSSGTQHTRVLNTVAVNQIAGASLASNQITLPAGTYRIQATAPAFAVDRHKLRLRNVTDGATELVGNSHFTRTSPDTEEYAQLRGQFTIADEKTYVAQYAALGEDHARHVLRPGIVRDADPGLREHELYAYYYDRVDQPAVAHDEG